MQEAFLGAAGGRAMMLPQIRPISEGEEDLTLLAGLASPGTLGTDALDLPPAMSELERRLVLTRLILRWSETMRAARAMPRTSASMPRRPAPTRRRRRRTSRPTRAPDGHGRDRERVARRLAAWCRRIFEHWQQTLDFLEIITEFWPAISPSRG